MRPLGQHLRLILSSHPAQIPQASGRQRKGPAFFSYLTNYLIDTDHSVIVDVEGTKSIKQAEVGFERTMLDRIKKLHGIDPERLIADTAYGGRSDARLVGQAWHRTP